MSVKVTFHGACGTVTGSCFEVRTGRAAVLVDCGMFQGTKTVKALNYEPFPFPPSTIAAVLLTHAHIDHCGLLPRLVGHGFGGPILTTAATADLLSYVLPDSGYIQELEVERVNRRNQQRGRAAVAPIYTRADAEATLGHIRTHGIGDWFAVATGIRARFWDAAHILGSVSVELELADGIDGKGERPLRLLFSGDIGPGEKEFHGQPQGPTGMDFVFMESTYGDRVRAPVTIAQRRHLLAEELAPTLRSHGLVLLPAFAVERTQELLDDLAHLFAKGILPRTPVFVDSPLAIRATKVFAKHLNGANGNGFHIDSADVHFVDDVADSRKLGRVSGGAIIMAGSGMCDAGRIRHHLKAHLAETNATVLLVGYQAPGTLGRLLLDGAPMVRIQGDEIVVSARIRQLDQYSGHADQPRLVAWAKDRLPILRDLILVHGEDAAREKLRELLDQAGIARTRVKLPVLGETLRLTERGAITASVRARLPSAAIGADWHNRLAESLLSLRSRVEKAPDDAARRRLLDRIEAAIRDNGGSMGDQQR
jgi:metallo-beta-lactamase family protein